MKRYEFELQAVLRARRLQQDVAKSGLQKANLAASAAEKAAMDSWGHYEELARPSEVLMMAQRELSELAAKAVLEARQAAASAQDTARAALGAYLESARAVTVLEKLDERRREEHRAEALREEALLSDEMAGVRHRRRVQASRAKGQVAP